MYHQSESVAEAGPNGHPSASSTDQLQPVFQVDEIVNRLLPNDAAGAAHCGGCNGCSSCSHFE
jgi:hypothetical protein